MPHVFALPAELTIYTAGEFHQRCQAEILEPLRQGQVPGYESCRVDASAVAEVDAAGLQLLLALARSLQEQALRLLLVRPSQALSAACEALGLQMLLQGGPEEKAAS